MKSNTTLFEDVADKLEMTPNLNHSHITVAIDDGLVTLAGTVGSLFEKYVAERAIKSIEGVKAVANNLKVNLADSLRLTDTDIAKAAIDALRWDVEVPSDNIQIIVEDGHVKLIGQVEWWYERSAAEKIVRRLRGVKSLANEIVIRPRITEREVKKQIVKEFHRHAQLDAEKIQVELKGNKVILKGNVRTFSELKEAEHAAWSIAGITHVDNQLSII